MIVEYDAAKNERNIAERNLPFGDVVNLDWAAALVGADNRRDYGETRYTAIAPAQDGRLHVVVFTEVPDGIRVISFRKANSREVKRYEQT